VIRYEFIDTAIREDDIHPDNIYKKEKKLAKAFVNDLKISKEIISCPICGTTRSEILFMKWGFQYAICPESWSLSLASLPGEDEILKYYYDSELSHFRSSQKYQNIVLEKRKDLWDRQLGWMEGRISRYLGNDKYNVIDWGGKFVGWVELLDTASFVKNLFVLESLPPIQKDENYDDTAEIVCLMEVLQREIKPLDLLKRISKKLNSGGLLIISCRAGSGFDIVTLREKSESVFPLDHIFLPSPQGMEYLLKKAGFDLLEITTPGLMDMKYIKNVCEKIPKNQFFLRYIMEKGDDLLLERMQGFLQRNNLSSHLRCIARKR
jgi:hypothetical protein